MSRVAGERHLVQLTTVEAIHEKLQSDLQGFWTAGTTTRSASEPGQVMTQFSVTAFHRVGIRFALGDFINTPVIPQAFVGIESITVVTLGLGSVIHHFLNDFLGPLPDDFEAEKAAGEPVYDRDDEDLLFLSPIKVNNSSISASVTLLGTGGSGSWSA